jgi:hypothetical protein
MTRTFVAVLALVSSASLTFAQDTVRVRGTIERVEGQTFVVKSRDGAELKVVLADNALVVAIVKASISDIKPGAFVGVTGMPQAGARRQSKCTSSPRPCAALAKDTIRGTFDHRAR